MKKFLFIALAVVLALSIGLIGCTGPGGGGGKPRFPANWNYTAELTMHCTIASSASIVTKVYLPWVAAVENYTSPKGGKFHFTITYGEGLFKSDTSLYAIGSGAADVGQLSPDTFDLGGLGYLPWFFPNMSAAAYTLHIMLRDEVATWDVKGQLDDVKILIASPLQGAQWWGVLNVTVPSDLSGVPVRAEAHEVAMLQALNATAINIGTADVAQKIQDGTVDGCFFTYTGIQGFVGLGPVTNYTTELNVQYRPYMLAMCKATYNLLPADAQAALDSFCTWNMSVQLALNHKAGEAYNRMLTNADRTIYVPNSTEMQLWMNATNTCAPDWVTWMNGQGYNGTGILARANTLIGLCPY